MPVLEIPDTYQPGVLRLAHLDDGSLARLITYIHNADFSLSNTELAEKAHSVITDVDQESLGQMLLSLRSLYTVRAAIDEEANQFIEDLIDAVLKIDPALVEKRLSLISSFEKLLNITELNVYVKARDLQTEDERRFCRARILTDLRPVFGKDIDAGPAGMVIVHTLKLGFDQEAREHHTDFYVTLDAEDLGSLKKVIERAEAKEKSLRKNLSIFAKPTDLME